VNRDAFECSLAYPTRVDDFGRCPRSGRLVWLIGACERLAGAPRRDAPRSVGSGITVVPGTVPVAQNSGPAPVATQPPPASVATATPPQNAASAAVQALERRDEFIKRSVMQSICRGC